MPRVSQEKMRETVRSIKEGFALGTHITDLISAAARECGVTDDTVLRWMQMYNEELEDASTEPPAEVDESLEETETPSSQQASPSTEVAELQAELAEKDEYICSLEAQLQAEHEELIRLRTANQLLTDERDWLRKFVFDAPAMR